MSQRGGFKGVYFKSVFTGIPNNLNWLYRTKDGKGCPVEGMGGTGHGGSLEEELVWPKFEGKPLLRNWLKTLLTPPNPLPHPK